MKYFSLKHLILLLAFTSSLFSEENSVGIKEINYDARINYSSSDFRQGASLSTGINFPLYEYLGGSAFIATGKSYGKDNFADTVSYRLGGDIFLQDSSIGRIGSSFGYGHYKDEFSDSEVKFTTKSYRYSLYGQYYYNDFTFSYSRSRGKSKLTSDSDITIFGDTSNTYNAASVGISWYINDNIKTTLSAGAMDARDSYHASISYQPKFLNESTEFSLRVPISSNIHKSFSISLVYNFTTQVNLKTRDREYR